jgi:hypothetical protein
VLAIVIPEIPNRSGVGATYHLVDSLNDSQHFIVTNFAVSVDIVQLECPVQLILHLAPARYAQGTYKLLEIDCTRLIGVKDVEDIVCETGGIAEGEELLVDLLELLFREHAAGAVF